MALINPNLLRTPKLAQKVLLLLKNMHPLPETGIVAGQSVACAIDYVLDTGTPVFNDIDVFMTARDWKLPEPVMLVGPPAHGGTYQTEPSLPTGFWKGKMTSQLVYSGDVRELVPSTGPSNAPDEYSSLNTHQNFYSVVAAKREGLLNKVLVSYFSNDAMPSNATLPKREIAEAQMLVRGFDINSTQVAINLRTQQLFFTPAFEKYFSTRQLEIVALFTPVHSILRYFKKRKELGVFGNDDAMLAMFQARFRQASGFDALSRARARSFRSDELFFRQATNARLRKTALAENTKLPEGPIGTGLFATPLVFGTKYKPLLDQYGAPLAELLTPIKHPNRDLWLLSPSAVSTEFKRYSLPRNSARAPLRFNEQYFPQSKQVAARVARFQALLGELATDEKRKRFVPVFEGAYAEKGLSFLDGIESAQLESTLRVMTEHEELDKSLPHLPFASQIQFVQEAKRAMKDAGLENLWGAFARCGDAWATHAIADPTLIRAKVEEIRQSMQSAVEPLPLPSEINGVTVTELVSGYALTVEGSKMNHCVGGYISQVKNGYCRIVSLSAGESRLDRSTTEWGTSEPVSARDVHYATREVKRKDGTVDTYKKYPLQFTLRQTRTFSNQTPNEVLLAAEEQLRNQVNKWLEENPLEGLRLVWPDRYETLLEDFAKGEWVPCGALKALLPQPQLETTVQLNPSELAFAYA